ncbi:hypothetical protein [Consotaella aegiceratis]|uniref:hypothetical protein n=1 Tax=Consotaella aegiceratis TaxID=3097961 RepID=UPI002F3F1588
MIDRWIEGRRQVRIRWQRDARILLERYGNNAYYEAQRRAAGARIHNHRDFWHWAKVAAEVARLSPDVGMDVETVQAIVDDELNCRRRNK